VWTPKRILLLATGFFLFIGAYFVYSHFLGGIDGLPPLPAGYEFSHLDDAIPVRPFEDTADEKLRKAFGVDCEEITHSNIKLVLDSKRMVLAAGDFSVEEDGRVKLMRPFGLAIFGKDKGDHSYPEINTIKCDEAYITFDEKVKNIIEMSGRRIVAAELRSNIYVINNRRTAQRDDDLSLFTQGPLYYDESQHLIFSKDAPVRMVDPSAKPNPNVVSGVGLYVHLKPPEKAPPAAAQAAAKSKGGMTTDVERIVIPRDVDMNLWVDARSGFLGSNSPNAPKGKPGVAAKSAPPPAAAAAAQAEKAKVVIMTQGPFTFNPQSNVATFDISNISGGRPNVVTVDRLNEADGKQDHLQCEHLHILFHKKNGAPESTGGSDQAEGLDVETAQATGKEVVLTSDAELLEAHGNDFFYDKTKQLSILKGSPRMWALKEGNEIEAPELELHQQKGAEQAVALGAGHIKMLDKKTGKRPLEARWKDRLIYAKEAEQDVLTLRGDAIFLDDEHKQKLAADLLKVWLLPAEGTAPKAAVAKEGEEPQRKPRKIDAVGHVNATGQDMNVKDAEHLALHFKDVPPAEGQLPPIQPAAPAGPKVDTPSTPPAATVQVLPPTTRPPAVTAQTKPAVPSTTNKPIQADAAKTKKPIDLSARSVTAFIRRAGEKNDLDELWCEGTVRVKQEASSPEDRGVDIRGDTLKLNHLVDGNILVVTGEHAQVQINKITILGPEVNIDQTSNEVWVTGIGVMRMLSKSNFDGKELDKPTELVVSWDNRMLFDGQMAKFRGNVQGEQDTGHLAAPWMDVTLDRKISLKEGDKSGPPAKVQKLVCGDKQVWMEDVKMDGKRVVSAKRIDCPQLSVDNDPTDEETQIEASGPGVVRIFQQRGQGDMMPDPNAKKPTPKPPVNAATTSNAPTELTVITFDGKMVGNNKRGSATFYDRVSMLNFPTEDPDFKLRPGRLPPGHVYLTCEQLEVLNRKLNDNTSVKEMRAYRNVSIEGPEYSGHADILKYDESKEQIILEGSQGSPAILYRERVKGATPDVIRGRVITYSRNTGLYHVEDAVDIKLAK
jgi:lipopolysaccharide export system protein LptA